MASAERGVLTVSSGIAALIGIGLTLSIFLANVIFRAGRHDARIEALEQWRGSIRQDMHEISDKLETLSTNVKHLSTLLEERTERRVGPPRPLPT